MAGKVGKVICIFILVAVFLVGCSNVSSENANEGDKVFKVGISQIIEHPALDAAREGFIKALEKGGFVEGENIEFESLTAQGDISTAQTIANRFVSNRKDLILAISTPSAQSAFNATNDIPILITAVTDPITAGIVKGWDKTETNVTGTSDFPPMDRQFALINELLPEAKKVGILYNTSEVNSEVQVNKAKELAPEFGLEIMTSSVSSINDVHQSLNFLLRDVDVVYTITDNVIASSIQLITETSLNRGIPVIGAEKAHVEGGALATEGIDYYRLGFETGIIAIEVLNGSLPENMGISTLQDTELIINLDVANKLNIKVPRTLKDRGSILGGE